MLKTRGPGHQKNAASGGYRRALAADSGFNKMMVSKAPGPSCKQQDLHLSGAHNN